MTEAKQIQSAETENKRPTLLGGASIITCVCVGAGMLGLPSVGAGAWTFWSILAVTTTMLIMTVSGWMLLEAFRNYDLRASFSSVTRDLLGNKVNSVNNAAAYFVGAILLYAYITSSGMIIHDLLSINSRVSAILFVLVFSGIVWHSTQAVDRLSVVLVLMMMLSFAFGIAGLLSRVELSLLMDSTGSDKRYAPYAIAMLPIALTSFGYHHSVSSMRSYYGDEKRARYAILGGTSMALFLYVFWLVSIFGNLARSEFLQVIEQGGNVDALLRAIDSISASESVATAIQIFSMAAIVSSFVGVGLGVFDFLADFFQFENSWMGRTKSWLVTFIPPLICSLFFPFGFVIAIGYAGAAATLWTCIIPALLVWKSREKSRHCLGVKLPKGYVMIFITILFGVLTAVVHFMAMMELLPVFNG